MRLVTRSVVNLSEKPKTTNLAVWRDGRDSLSANAPLNGSFAKPSYSTADTQKILEGLSDLRLLEEDDAAQYPNLHQSHGKRLKRPESDSVMVIANGRGNWIGWLDLKKGPERDRDRNDSPRDS